MKIPRPPSIPAAILIGFFIPAVMIALDIPKPPVISDAHKAAFFKAQYQLLQANQQMQAAQAAMTAAVELINKDCGDSHQPQIDPQADPVCTDKIPVVNKPPASPQPEVPASHPADKDAQHPKG